MKIGGRCPLNHIDNQEQFLRQELEKFYNKSVDFDGERLRKEFCRKICSNIMC